MKYLEKDDALFKRLINEMVILDSSVIKFNIYYQENGLGIEIDLVTCAAKKRFRLIFSDVTEYSFYWNSKYSFYYVERYKLFKHENSYYLSLDPYDEHSKAVDENDQDIILSSDLEVYQLED